MKEKLLKEIEDISKEVDDISREIELMSDPNPDDINDVIELIYRHSFGMGKIKGLRYALSLLSEPEK